ncbi:type II toxin-antitoxin system HicB family antitoxin [Candidatus Peregrinibacteria bacterium]|nr:type II toxin-antitoxin system HicB family antitoxin [Candidatus Peregrinibacteria bacterium]
MTPLPTVAIELIPDQELGGFTAHIPDIPAYGEGETEEEAIADLKTGLQLFVEANGLEAALHRINAPSHIRQVNLGDLVAHG